MKRNLFSISLIIILAFGLWSAMPTTTALAATCLWNGSSNTDWATAANWTTCNGIIPQPADSVTIPTGLLNYPTIATSVTILGVQINSGASVTVGTGGSLDVVSILINSGGLLTVSGGSLSIRGNFTCNGTLTATGSPTSFLGTANQTVSGSGTTTFGTITINNTGPANNNIVEIMPTVFHADVGFLTLTQGILKLSGTYTLSNTLFVDNNYVIPAGAGVWLNNPNVTVTAAPGSAMKPILNGSLRITAGNYNVGNAVNKAFEYNSGSSLTIEGGSLSVASWFAANSGVNTSIDFTMSGGTFTLGTVAGFTSGSPTLSIQGTSSHVNISGGTIVLQNENTAGAHDFRIGTDIPATVITGGTVQFGNSSTTDASPSFEFELSYLPSMVIAYNGSNTPSVVAYGNSTILGNVTIGANTTFNANGNFISISGNSTAPGNWTNNGTFTDTSGGIVFNGSVGQNIGGANNSNFYNLLNSNLTAGGVTLARDETVLHDMVNNAGTLFNLSTHTLSVGGTLSNSGILRATQDVNGSSDVNFFHTGSYGGVILNAHGSDLGTTTVSIWGNHDCTNVLNDTVKRCFYINPTNTTSQDATITFYFGFSELVGGNSCNTLDAYHFSLGWGSPLTLDSTYGTGGRDCVSNPLSLRVVHVGSFSPFVLKSAAPTVITLRNLTAQSRARISLVLFAGALGLLVLGGGLLYLRGRKVL